jgi:Reverse transcriptase (RNA-dependent DNA polymerase)
VESDIKYSAQLVVNESVQCPDVDVEDTFTPTINKKRLRIVLALWASLNCVVHQMELETAFLHGRIDQYTVMELPLKVKGSSIPSEYVEVLKKAFYQL